MPCQAVEKSGENFRACEMQQHAFAFVLVAAEVQRVRPRDERVVRAEGFDAVVTRSIVSGEHEVVGREFQRLLVKAERLVENLLLVDAVKFPRVFAVEINGRGKILVIDRLGGIEADGFGVAGEGVGQFAVVAVVIRELVPDGGIFWVELFGIFILHLRAFFIAGVVQKTAVGEEAARAVGMIAEEGVVVALHCVEPEVDAGVEQREGVRVGAGNLVGVDPGVDFVERRVVADHQVAEVAFGGIVGITNGQGHAGVFGDEVAHCDRLVRGQQRAQKSESQITHGFKVSILKVKDRI